MSREITTEILANAIDETKDTVQTKNTNVRLKIQGKNRLQNHPQSRQHPIQPTKCHGHRPFR